ncbi:MAG: hypothetical protein OQJ97_06030 [Rhodospirillales bacterium]|nr:hypothetical protein [Rhodospirillales bacterium]
MKTLLKFTAITLAAMLPLMDSAQAANEANWKIGRVYNRLVCNACHRLDDGKVVSPYERNKADWQVYFAADSHDTTGKANPSAKYYMGTDYRESIKATNKAAAKFLKMPNAIMEGHVIEFYLRGAKDSDTPARCQ